MALLVVVFGPPLGAEALSVGSLRFDVDYRGASGDFAGERANGECTAMLEAVFLSLNHDVSERVLSTALVVISGVQGPADLAACTFLSAGVFDPAQLRIEVVDASDPGRMPTVPLSVVTISAFPGALPRI